MSQIRLEEYLAAFREQGRSGFGSLGASPIVVGPGLPAPKLQATLPPTLDSTYRPTFTAGDFLRQENFELFRSNLPDSVRLAARGVLAPLGLILKPWRMDEIYNWDRRWAGRDQRPNVQFYEERDGKTYKVIKDYATGWTAPEGSPPNLSWAVFDARDKLICGGGGCNQPYNTWFAITPSSNNVYCSPDTLISVLFQEPRYRKVREQIKYELANPPNQLFEPDDLRPRANMPPAAALRWARVTPAQRAELTQRLAAPGADTTSVRELFAAQLNNEIIGNNAAAWAAWCARLDGLSRMAVWASNVRAELLYDWLDPANIIESKRYTSGDPILGPAIRTIKQRGWVGNPDTWDREVSRRTHPLLTETQRGQVRVSCAEGAADSPHAAWPLHRPVRDSSGSRYVRQEALRLRRFQGLRANSTRDRELFSCHLWNVNNEERNLSRWLTHRYPLTATLFQAGLYTTGGNKPWSRGSGNLVGEFSDQPWREAAMGFRLPLDLRYFILDNTVPLPFFDERTGKWYANSQDGWQLTPGATEGALGAFLSTPFTPGTISSVDESNIDECERRTIESLRHYFATARSGVRHPWSPLPPGGIAVRPPTPAGPVDFTPGRRNVVVAGSGSGTVYRSATQGEGNPATAKLIPLDARGLAAAYRRKEVVKAPCTTPRVEIEYGGSARTLDPSGQTLSAAEQFVWVPSPDSYVRGVIARAKDIDETSFGDMVARGAEMYADMLEMYYGSGSSLPAGARPQDFRNIARSFTQMDLDSAAGIFGQYGGTLSSMVSLVTGPVGALIAAIVFVSTELIRVAQDAKLMRGGNPITIPMAFARYIEADPLGLLAECDFNPSRDGYDSTIPQVAVVEAAARGGWIGDATRLFGSLGAAVGSVEVPEQEEYTPPPPPPPPIKAEQTSLVLPIASVLSVGALLLLQRRRESE